MATTIRIRARNEAKPELAAVVQDLDRVETAAGGAAEALESMAAADLATEIHHLVAEMRANNNTATEQKLIVADLRKSWLQFTAETITNLRTVGGAIKDATGFTADQVRKVKDLADGSRTAVIGVNLLQSATIRGAASWTAYGATVGTVLTGLAAVKATALGVETLLANTGKKKTGSREDFSATTPEQQREFNKLAEQSRALVIDIESLMEAQGKRWEDFGVKIVPEVETNLTRVQSATAQLKDDIRAFAEGGLTAAKELGVEFGRLYLKTFPFADMVANVIPPGLKMIDDYGTKVADNLTEGMSRAGEAIRGVSHETVKASRALDDLQKRTKDDFARVRISEQQAQQAGEARAEAARVAGLATTQAIDEELEKLKERRGIMAANDQFDEAAQKKYLDTVEALERRRTQLLDERNRQEAEARKKELDAERDRADWLNRQEQQRLKDHNDRITKENEAYEKGLDEEVKLLLEQHKEQQKAFEDLTKKKAEEAKKQRDEYVKQWREAVGEVANIVSGQKGGGTDQMQQIRDSLSQRDKAKIVGNRRRTEALEDFDRNTASDWRKRLIDQGVDSREADRRVEAGRNKVGNQAFARGFGDVVRGRASQDEITDAENRMVAAVGQQAAANKDLHPALRQGIQDAAQLSITAAQEAVKTRQTLDATIAALQAAQKNIRAVNGSNRR